ncbi:DnaD domain protein [Carnobacteriaceae bacterium zg-ZUI78]|uniref:DnaD domain-containing protein n=1 Tax=Granulicatella sp. zg-84 TaxID=2678503 RepID=UPI0013C1BAF9|nr:DnaD domain protein [Granulicatella sp. zg-84]MBS4750552.1 DnaD domain protein [Carnobacteriaceae bacterium zg-ZUI78]NEW66715.1 DnaD domain protein [Granulicatella sp. zg-84]QMI85306.1 DnaD domain protein [Carnobacteriaceae bacterium zg-84]
MREKLLASLQAKPVTVSSTLLTYYTQLGMTNDELALFLQFEYVANQDLTIVAKNMGISEQIVLKILQNLMTKQLVVMQQIVLGDGKIDLQYSFEPMYQKLVTLLMQAPQNKKETVNASDIVSIFEQEIGKPLTPMELEMLQGWLFEDHYEPDLIKLALKEASLNQVTSLKYIDKILLSWERKNIKTVAQAQKQSEQFREQQKDSQPITNISENMTDILMQNWLHEE